MDDTKAGQLLALTQLKVWLHQSYALPAGCVPSSYFYISEGV